MNDSNDILVRFRRGDNISENAPQIDGQILYDTLKKQNYIDVADKRILVGGAVNSVNSKTGDVVITASDLGLEQSATPQKYGAVGDGMTDDGPSFREALRHNRYVKVPGGTYKINGSIKIDKNCELELSQDTILNFTSIGPELLTMERSAYLKGNHATINVPYEMTGSAVLVSINRDEGDEKTVPPWSKWTPMWKSGRFIENINICKQNSDGYHLSTDGKVSGTALKIEGNDNPTSHIWCATLSGVRISGAFKYGVYIETLGKDWINSLKVEAFMESCETGVYIHNVSNVTLSAVVQPHAALNAAKYAKNGIKLENARNINAFNSCIWDWNAEDTLRTGYAPEDQNQHIAMYGNCSGFVMYDFVQRSSHPGYWKTIYSDNIASIVNATIFGPKGKVENPDYAFYKNFRIGGDEFVTNNVSYKDEINLRRLEVPVEMKNAYENPNNLYQIGHFDFADAENPASGTNDELFEESITIEENDRSGIIGYANLLFIAPDTVEYRYVPISPGRCDSIPIYYYTKIDKRVTIFRLIREANEIQQIYNCKIAITNARRFVMDFKSIGPIGRLNKVIYKIIKPVYDTYFTGPKLKGMFGLKGTTPVVCTASEQYDNNGAVTVPAVLKPLGGEGSDAYFVTPEKYGAVGDGVNDDTSAIQQAIDAQGAIGGGTVLFSKTYKVTDTVIIKGGVGLKGVNSFKWTDKAKIKAATPSLKPIFKFDKITTGIFVENLTVEEAGDSYKGSFIGFEFNDVEYTTFREVYVNNAKYGYYFNPGTKEGNYLIDLSDVSAQYCDIGIYFKEDAIGWSNAIKLQPKEVSDNRIGILAGHGYGNTINGGCAEIGRNTEVGIKIVDGQWVIQNPLWIEGSPKGIVVDGGVLSIDGELHNIQPIENNGGQIIQNIDSVYATYPAKKLSYKNLVMWLSMDNFGSDQVTNYANGDLINNHGEQPVYDGLYDNASKLVGVGVDSFAFRYLDDKVDFSKDWTLLILMKSNLPQDQNTTVLRWNNAYYLKLQNYKNIATHLRMFGPSDAFNLDIPGTLAEKRFEWFVVSYDSIAKEMRIFNANGIQSPSNGSGKIDLSDSANPYQTELSPGDKVLVDEYILFNRLLSSEEIRCITHMDTMPPPALEVQLLKKKMAALSQAQQQA